MAEFLFHETVISAPNGQAFLRVFADDVTGQPIRAEMRNITRSAYQLFIGLTNRSVGQTESATLTQRDIILAGGVVGLINVLCPPEPCVTDWTCGFEGA